MTNSVNSFQPQIHSSNEGGCIITIPNVNSGKSVVFSNSGDSGDMKGPEISVIRTDNNIVRGGNDGGQSASQHGMD